MKTFLLIGLLFNIVFADPSNFIADRIVYVNDYEINISVKSANPDSVSSNENWRELKDIRFSDIEASSFWLRKKVNLSSTDNPDDLSILTRGIHANFACFWNNEVIFDSRSYMDEHSGVLPYSNSIPVNNGKIEKENNLLIHIDKKDFAESNGLARIFIGDSKKIETRVIYSRYRDFFLAGFFAIATLIFFALYIGENKYRAYLIYTLSCATFLVEFSLVIYSYLPTTDVRSLPDFSQYIRWISAVQLFSLFWFMIEFFELENKNILLILSIIMAIMLKILEVPFITFLYSLYIFTIANYKRRIGALSIFIGWISLILLEMSQIYGYLDNGYYFGLALFNFFIVIAISRKRRIESNLVNEIKIKSAKLEADLLKKNIQPHFIMNTLLSINSWIEENPKQAQNLIVALAEEFRIVHKFSEKKLVSLNEEIELCKKHLKLMGLRKDAHYYLRTENLPKDQVIPPMIFHTLIENGLSHSFSGNEDGEFEISYNEEGNCKEYVIRNNGSLLKRFKEKSIEEGLGLRYVKSRLQESFSNKWELNYGLFDSKWVVQIKLIN